ncbi:peroxiredoxin [Bacillus sp. FJAT-42376]|uniref:peroxiredoxin family protein n=1 Tax=Bacillus sp. FJAT-42376 TaxID=2014076 RepID=UPI000F4DF027|nr:redoxin domain-containing protein [Bacillus sp. FJAT-42376]AZB44384.1 peroxiredoxin [Bacillus sp. FJAT-42376]
MPAFQLNQKAPDFSLPAVSGDTFSFEKHQKEHKSLHLVVFFRGSWCPVCISDLTSLQESKSYFEDKNVHMIAISTDKLDALKKMSEEHDFTFPVLADEKLEALEAYDVFYHGEDAPYEDHGVHGEPAYFLIDEEGKVLYQQRQTSPFGRPSVTELRKIVQYVTKNKK